VARALRAVRTGRTTIVVTASPSLLALADHVVLIDEGQVAAAGRHDDLIASDARYRQGVLR
jgi:putative ABC transport system ATP-binding protein